ncbi:MAG: sigma 54-interacting transcriptional regulator [Deltaproteobacteria bacterium]|nr:sigma 54-interacting transcriptional regulator [Deltaproteobacteria bacterium]
MISLIFMRNGISRFEFPLKRQISIGREKDNDICLADRDISKRHARIKPVSAGILIEDVSTNGVFVKGKRIRKQVELKKGDVFQMGGWEIHVLVDKKEDLPKTVIREAELTIKKLEKGLFPDLPKHLIAEDPKMLKVFSLVKAVAPSDATVLIQGETGVGKDEIARLLHFWSDRAMKPFIAINCATSTEQVLENALFGHERGAFTGATDSKAGCFEEAHGGTLFLDEIGEMPLSIQGSLLRVLEYGAIRRLGSGKKENRIDVRVVCGTNRNLKRAIREKLFREDLYYRLNLVPINIPALRERPHDIPKLVESFIQRQMKAPQKTFSPEAMGELMDYPWPGNIRQLLNAVLRLLLDPKVKDPIGTDDLNILKSFDSQESVDFGAPSTFDEAKRLCIISHLRAFPKDSIPKLAERIGVSRPCLTKMIRDYGIDVQRERSGNSEEF